MTYYSTESNIKKMVFASLFSALIAISAYIKIPLPLVPMTLQIFFILLAGSILGSKWGTLSIIVYLLLGIIGLPVFAGGASGLGVLLGPTGGYLIGFVFATFIIGTLSQKYGTSNILKNIVFMLIGLIVIYLIGIFFLMSVAHISIEKAIVLGIIPFILVDFIKLILAAIIASRYNLN